ncbi:Putative phage protein (fragment) [Clostridioides difficile T19]
MQEKKEDRDMYKKTVENFIELSTQQQEINKNILVEMGAMKTDVEEIKEDVTDIKVMLQKEGDK